MYYRWGPYFEKDCQDPNYVAYLHEVDAYQQQAKDTNMFGHTQPPIIILVDERDDILHTAEWPQCKDPTCPCQAEVQDMIADVPPSEAELDAQEQQTGGARSIDWDAVFVPTRADMQRAAAQERNITHQCEDGSWW